VQARLESLFPVAIPVEGRDAVLFVLNSVTRLLHHAAANAIGSIGREQHRRLDQLAQHFPQSLRLVAEHHHLVRRGEERGSRLVNRVMARFAVLDDAWRLVDFCRRHEVRAVLHGHRHLSYQLRLPGGCVLLAAPSSTLGDELSQDPRPQFERYEFAAGTPGRSVGIHRQVVRMPGTELLDQSPPAKQIAK
jgi:hypothetical protein